MDVLEIESSTKPFIVGQLSNKIIRLLGITSKEKKIIVWPDRVTYFRKHINDYESTEQFESCINAIPSIISNPDYVALHPSKGSIEYIKRIDKLMLVAVRIRDEDSLAVRSVFPLSEKQLKDYLNSGSAKAV